MPETFIPFHRPSIAKDDIAAVVQVLESRWLTTGPATRQFEREFASYIGCKHALAVNSCTAALQLALDAIGLKPGDEVLIPTYTFTATAGVVTYFGARPVLCDSVPGGFNIDPASIERHITDKTRAIIPVHIAGQACDMDAIAAIARKHNLHVVEDAAHALPTEYRGRRVGTISEMTAFSFYATKTITTAEGGMLATDVDEYAERASIMRLHGISGDAWKRYSKEGSWFYEVQDAGYKLNLSDILGALGSSQLRRSDAFFARRSHIAAMYHERFSQIEELENPPAADPGDTHAWHLFILRLRPDLLEIDRNQFMDELKRMQVGGSVHFIPLHLHPYYAREYGYRRGDFPNAENAYSRCLSLPIYPDLTDEEAERVVRSVERIVHTNRKRVLVAA